MTTASAICDATRRCRKPCPPRVSVPERESSRRREPRSPRAARREGRTPKSSTASSVTPADTPTGVPARRITSMRGSCTGAKARRPCSSHPAQTRPSAPPAVASSALSARSRRATWLELAPSARRITISGVRSEARSSSRLPTFTQTMRSSNVTAAVSATRTGFASPSTASVRVRTVAPVGYAGARRWRSSCCAMERNSDCADDGVALGARRATTSIRSKGRGRIQ